MTRERALKALLLVIGIALVWGLWPLVTSLRDGVKSTVSPGDQMILGIYFPLGVLLLVAMRNPSQHRSLILFAGWSTLTHMTVMAIQAVQAGTPREDLPPTILIAAVGALLLALAPRKRIAAASPGGIDAATPVVSSSTV